MTVDLFKGQEVGDLPKTPLTPVSLAGLTPISHRTLFTVGRRYGQPVGYLQEQHGNLVQNIVPNPKTEYSQISSSSKTTLALHTETCFHPYLPDYVLLLCLRGDENAVTTYANLSDILKDLKPNTIEVLKQPWFKTSVDESFRTNGEPDTPVNIPVLTEYPSGNQWSGYFRLRYDKSVMVGLWRDAVDALEELDGVIEKNTKQIVLETGDLLVIDNTDTVHGRKPFQARYDGTDRWLQRLLVRKNVYDIPSNLKARCSETGYTVIMDYKEAQ